MSQMVVRGIAISTLLGLSAMFCWAQQVPQPEMQAALRDLQRAQQKLQNSAENKGGHRAKALQLTQAAITNVQQGIQYAAQHGDKNVGALPAETPVQPTGNQPAMNAALQYLQHAEQYLRSGGTDKGGFRVKAANNVRQATQEVQAGMQFADARSGAAAQPAAAAAKAAAPGTLRVVAGPIPQRLQNKSAYIWWETDQPVANQVIKYGTNQGNLDQTATDSGQHQSHHVAINNLQPNAQYYVAVIGPNGQPLTMSSFKTEPEGYWTTNKFRLQYGPTVEYLTPNRAQVAWATTMPTATDIVRYGSSPAAMPQVVQAANKTGNHRAQLTGLQPNTQYWFQVESTQQGTGAKTMSDAFPFQTLNTGEAPLNIGQEK
jgi:hypothetical protein